MSLTQQFKAGIIWTFAQQFATQIVNFIVSIVLARLLSPSDFGMIALFGIFMGVATVFVEGGMVSSLVRSKDVDDSDFKTVFTFNLLMSILMYSVIFFIAPLIANFYEIPELVSIIRVYSIVLIISAWTSVPKAILTKDLDFKKQFYIQLPSIIISAIVGISLAWKGYGVWALVYTAIIQTALMSLQYWYRSDWKPRLGIAKEKFSYHFNFGYKLMFSRLLDTAFQNLYPILIGKFFTTAQLGYYDRAQTLKNLPVTNLSMVLNRVTLPLFAKIQDDEERLRRVYKQIMQFVVFVIAPVMMLLMIISEPLIRFMLTEKWMPVVPILNVLLITGIFYPLHSYNLNILFVKGRSDLFLRLEIAKKIVTVLTIMVTIRYGIMGLVWGQVVTSTIALFINSFYSGKFLDYSIWKQFRDLYGTIIFCTVIALGVYSIDRFFLNTHSDIIRLLVLSSIFITFYIGGSWLMKFPQITFLIDNLKRKK